MHKWSEVTTDLYSLDPRKLHYVKVPENHIVIDFDLKNSRGEKDLEINLEAANKWPPTYCEVSKGGQGLHLHYIYTGEPTKLDRLYSKGIEVKVFTGGSSLRRKLTRCNTIPVSTISSGLPLRKEKTNVINDKVIKNQRQMRAMIANCLMKKYDGLPGTKVSVDFIKDKILEPVYESGMPYDISDMRPDIMNFAANSTNHSDYCIKQVKKMKFKSEDKDKLANEVTDYPEKAPIVFYDVEVFPNLFVICWKKLGGKKVVRMINPTPEEVRKLYPMRLVGFNNRRYDNHIIFAAGEGYTNPELYEVSQRIINQSANAFFGLAYDLSYTDIYDFASAGNKKSLKKFEIELGIHHQELGLPWDQEVSEDMWEKVADYCCHDVEATEAVWKHLQADFAAREILVDLANKMCPEIKSTVNDTTNTLSTRIIFGNNRHPQSEFNYRDLSKPMHHMNSTIRSHMKPEVLERVYSDESFKFIEEACPGIGSSFKDSTLPYFPGYKFENGESTYRGVAASEGGYVYAEPGAYHNVALLDVASMHPSSIIAECLFGPKYTQRFKDIRDARLCVKTGDWDKLGKMLDGIFKPYISEIEDGSVKAKDLSNALKTVINSVYGLTKAGFDNPFKDPRNVDNIVAKRGALFMIDLQKYVQGLGYQVIHIKTDSIKIAIADADDSITSKVLDFGKSYGYTFELEAMYAKLCLVNKAVYIAQDMDGEWTATGDQFKVPYVFKTLFSHQKIRNADLVEVFNVKTALYLDYNESLGEDEHSYQFIGRTGAFYPIKEGCGGAELRVKRGESYYYPAGAKDRRWLEAEVVEQTDRFGDVDMTYWEQKAEEAKKAIEAYYPFEQFINGIEFMNPPEDEEAA